MKNKTMYSVGALLATGLAGVAAADFDGPYDPTNWTFNNNGGNGFFTNDGFTLVLTGNDAGGKGINTDYTIMVVADGDWSFNWNYSSIDDFFFHGGGYLLNGQFFELGNPQFLQSSDDPPLGSRSGSVAVSFGDIIGFRVHSVDASAGVLTIGLFGAPVPGPAAAALLGVAGLLSRRSRRRRT